MPLYNKFYDVFTKATTVYGAYLVISKEFDSDNILKDGNTDEMMIYDVLNYFAIPPISHGYRHDMIDGIPTIVECISSEISDPDELDLLNRVVYTMQSDKPIESCYIRIFWIKRGSTYTLTQMGIPVYKQACTM